MGGWTVLCGMYFDDVYKWIITCTLPSCILQIQLVDFLVAVCLAKVAGLHHKELVIRNVVIIIDIVVIPT